MTTQQTASSVLNRSQVAALRRRELNEVLSAWQKGAAPDAVAAVEANPSLAVDRSVLIELAHTEFRLRRKAGEDLSSDEFCRRFPSIEYSLRQCLNCYSLLANSPASWSSHREIDWPTIGSEIAGFEILDELGRGAFSRVYLAEQPEIDRLVAVKASLGEIQEAKILARLSHPNIVPLLTFHRCEAVELILLCMPHRARATLADALDVAIAKGPQELTGDIFGRVAVIRGDDRNSDQTRSNYPSETSYVNAVLRVGLAIAEALEYAHAAGVLHLDVKPSNILLAFDGTPLLVDFNLAIERSAPQSRVGGTLPYMAPEVLQSIGDSSTLIGPPDGRADVYSLGVVLYQLLSLRLPFEIERFDMPLAAIAGLHARRIAWEPPPLSLSVIAIDDRTRRLIRRMLAADPADRPTAGEAAAELKRCLSVPVRLRRGVRSRQPASTIVACTALLVTVAISFATYSAAPNVGANQANDRSQASGINQPSSPKLLEVSPDPLESTEVRLAQARALMSAQRYSEALVEFEKLKSSEKELDALAAICYCACRIRQYALAIEAGQAYRAKGGAAPAVLNNLGHALLSERRYPEAEAVLNDACNTSSPALEAALFNRAYIEVVRPHAPEAPINPQALADFRELVKRDVKSGEPYFWFAGLLINNAAAQAVGREDILSLLRTSVRYGAQPKTVMSVGPNLKVISQRELTEIAGGAADAGRRFAYDPLLMPLE